MLWASDCIDKVTITFWFLNRFDKFTKASSYLMKIDLFCHIWTMELFLSLDTTQLLILRHVLFLKSALARLFQKSPVENLYTPLCFHFVMTKRSCLCFRSFLNASITFESLFWFYNIIETNILHCQGKSETSSKLNLTPPLRLTFKVGILQQCIDIATLAIFKSLSKRFLFRSF